MLDEKISALKQLSIRLCYLIESLQESGEIIVARELVEIRNETNDWIEKFESEIKTPTPEANGAEQS